MKKTVKYNIYKKKRNCDLFYILGKNNSKCTYKTTPPTHHQPTLLTYNKRIKVVDMTCTIKFLWENRN